MPESELLLKNRFTELARRAFSRECYVYSEFLTTAEQDILCQMAFDGNAAPFTLSGGYETAERKLACFGGQALCGYTQAPPIVCILIAPVSKKFADELSHRDFLGSLMALGFRRNVLGDIVINDNCGYLFCLDSVAAFVAEQFTQVKHTTVSCALTQAPDFVSTLPEPVLFVAASQRLDAIVAAVYKLSRSESQRLFAQRRVFVNSKPVENTSFVVASGCVVSVRGFGRFLYEGIETETRKGRLKVSVRVF